MSYPLHHSANDSFNNPSLTTLACTSLGVLTGGRSPGITPFWFIPGGLPANGINFALAVPAACARKSPVDAIGAMPHLPMTQPPTSRPRPPCHSPFAFADGCGEDELPEATRPDNIDIDEADAESLAERRFKELALTSAMDATGREEGRVPLVGIALDEKPRPSAKICEELFFGMCMSIPEIETRLSCEFDRRRLG
jgi:hypothetical protein